MPAKNISTLRAVSAALFALPDEGGLRAANASGERPAAPRVAAALLGMAVAVGVAEVLVVRATVPDAAFSWGLFARSALSCMAAGLLEEALFRGALFPVLIRALQALRPQSSRAVVGAAVLQAVVFALLHLLGTLPDALTWVVGVQALAKVAGAFAFGMCMAALYLGTRTLGAPIGVHAAYDLLSVAPKEGFTGPATTYLTGSVPDAVLLVATALALVAICVFAAQGSFANGNGNAASAPAESAPVSSPAVASPASTSPAAASPASTTTSAPAAPSPASASHPSAH